VLVGAGGAGSAVADALLRCGTALLTVVDVDAGRAQDLAGALARRHGRAVDAASAAALTDLVPAADGVVHCTPVGMAEHPGTAFDVALLRPTTWVADVVYRPLETELLLGARAAGCRTLDGGHMAVHQAVGAFELITGHRPDAARMLAHLRALVRTP
jgi:shikimate dehydrogenase